MFPPACGTELDGERENTDGQIHDFVQKLDTKWLMTRELKMIQNSNLIKLLPWTRKIAI